MKMQIVVMTLGSRGDLQPFVALGLGLQNAGYDVLLVSAKNEAAFVAGFGLKFCPLDVNIQQLMEGPDVQAMTKGDNPIAFFKSHLKSAKSLKQTTVRVQAEVWQACQSADAIIYHPGMANGYFIACELGIPAIMASPFPVTATADYPAILFYNGPRLGRFYNLLTHFIFEKLFWQLSKPALQTFWEARLQPGVVTSTAATKLQETSGMPVLYGYSERLFKRSAEWSANIHVTGSWAVAAEPAWTAPAALLDFLRAGPAPVYVGFGSLRDVAGFEAALALIVAALQATNQRAVIALGWNKMPTQTALPTTVFLLDSAPHSWLFPQMVAVVHHGGAGTTAAGLRAGKPTVIIPHSADQPAWGRRVYELGVGAAPIPRKKLTADKLAAAIGFVLTPEIQANAAALGQKLRTENGVENAVRIVDDFLKK